MVVAKDMVTAVVMMIGMRIVSGVRSLLSVLLITYQIPSISLFPGSSSLHLCSVDDIESNHGSKTSYHEEWDKDKNNEILQGAHGVKDGG